VARDYAHSGRSRRSGGRSGGMPGWLWLFAGLALGFAATAFYYIRRPPPALPRTVERAEPAPRKASEPVKLPPREKPRFTFYELLPSEEVVVPREETKPAAKPPAAAGSAAYVLQVGSFRVREEAEKQKATLALLGVESRIETVTIDGADTFYRVRVGPLSDFGKVQIITSRLEDNGIPALVVKVK
jgi:cell division protein FtsN